MQLQQRIGSRLKLRDLNILLTVVKERSMSKAGAVLAISQPAISKAIADMEYMLGAPLLDRTPRGIEPTLYGRALIKRGLAIFDELRHCAEDIESLLDPSIGTARIGCTEPLAVGLVPHVIEGLNRRHPRVSFIVVEGQQFGTLQRELRDRNIELMIGRAPDLFRMKIWHLRFCSTTGFWL
jgi:DNA-binding transcriptional LysR family regulator